MDFVIEFPAVLRVCVSIMGGTDAAAFADAVIEAREKAKATHGLDVAFQKGKITDRRAEPDPRD